jgi:hypothetical protein
MGHSTKHIATRKPGTKHDPIDNAEQIFSDVVRDWKPDILLWVMCKFDCPPGLLTTLRKLRPEMRTVFHSFDDPQQIDATWTPWAKEFEYAITCCAGSIPWYEEQGVRAVCLYPPADRDLHGGAQPIPDELCDFAFAATNVYAPELYPRVLARRTDIARAADKIGKLHLYGPWDGSRSTWGGEPFGAPDLKHCYRKRFPWDKMPGIYASAGINLNSHNRPDGFQYLNERTIHAMASGAFLLTDRVAGIEELFEPGVHFDTWGNLEEAVDKIEYWHRNPDKRALVAASGKAFTLEHYDNVAHNRNLLRFLDLTE